MAAVAAVDRRWPRIASFLYIQIFSSQYLYIIVKGQVGVPPYISGSREDYGEERKQVVDIESGPSFR